MTKDRTTFPGRVQLRVLAVFAQAAVGANRRLHLHQEVRATQDVAGSSPGKIDLKNSLEILLSAGFMGSGCSTVVRATGMPV